MAPRIKTSDVEWLRHDFIELLAHLDFIVEDSKRTSSFSKRDAELHQQDILHQLRQKLNNRYSAAQIKTKLWNEIRNEYQYPEENFQYLFIHGSSEIHALNSETRERVREQCASICYMTPPTRRFRSSPLAPSPISRRKPAVSTKLADKLKIQKRRPKSRTSTPLTVHNRVTRSASRICVKSECVSAGDGDEHPLSTSTNVCVPSTKASAIEVPRGYALREVRCSTEPSTPSELSDTATSASDFPEKPNENDGRSTAFSSCRSTPSPTRPAASSVVTEIEELHWDVAYFRNRCRKVEEEYANFQRCVRQKQSIYTVTKAVPDKIQEELEKNVQQILTLKKKLSTRSHFRPYLALDTIHGQAPNAQKVYDAFKDFRSEFTSLLMVTGLHVPVTICSYINSMSPESDLASLLANIVGQDPQRSDTVLTKSLFSVPINALLQALTSAAVHNWVFHQDVRCMEMMSTPLLEKYRSCIECICGQDALSRLDLAAHQSLFDEKHFGEETVPRVASKHTERLLEALHPLIKDKIRSSTTSELRSTLFGIFSLAVKAKCLNLVSKLEYEIIWPPCSAHFDRDCMETKSPSLNGQKGVVRIPLVPGFRIVANDGMMATRQLSGNDPSSTGNSAIVAKALVMV